MRWEMLFPAQPGRSSADSTANPELWFHARIGRWSVTSAMTMPVAGGQRRGSERKRSHAGRTSDVIAASCASTEERWTTLSAATFLRRAGRRAPLERTMLPGHHSARISAMAPATACSFRWAVPFQLD